MIRSPEPSVPFALPSPLPALRRIGSRIDLHSVVDSTNSRAFEAAAAGAPDGAVIVADAQRAGRGRLGRAWSSPTGCNLYLSILLRGPFHPPVVTGLPFLAAVATRDAVAEVTGLIAQLKWPNDLVIHDRKVGGILVEARSAGGKTMLAVVGIGVNVNWPRSAMPVELQATATSLTSELGRSIDRPTLLTALLSRLDLGYDRLCDEGVAWLIEDWNRSCAMLGRTVFVETPDGPLTGVAEAVEPSGHLRLRRPDGSTSRLTIEATTRLRNAEPLTPAMGATHALRD